MFCVSPTISTTSRIRTKRPGLKYAAAPSEARRFLLSASLSRSTRTVPSLKYTWYNRPPACLLRLDKSNVSCLRSGPAEGDLTVRGGCWS